MMKIVLRILLILPQPHQYVEDTPLTRTIESWWSLKQDDDVKRLSVKIDMIPSLLSKWSHWGRLTHICVGKLTTMGSDNGLSPGRRQAIIWTNAGISLIGPLETNCSEILITIFMFSFKKMHLKMSSGKRCPFCPASMWYIPLAQSGLRAKQTSGRTKRTQRCLVVEYFSKKVESTMKTKLGTQMHLAPCVISTRGT